MSRSRFSALAMLAGANLLWAGNWVTGRALRETFEPVGLSLWRWLLAAVVLAPFALPGLRGKGDVIRRHAVSLVLLALTGAAAFQALVYLGLRSTTAINGVLLNSSQPLFILLCSWIITRERPQLRPLAGMAISLAGILVILSHGSAANLLTLEVHPGDAWILLAMPVFGIYSVLLRHRPPPLGGIELLFLISLLGVLLLAPLYALELWLAPPTHMPSPEALAGVVYVGIGASVLGFLCWNRGVKVVGANTAGYTLHLLPAFGTVLAMMFLGETFAAYHAVGIVTILAGVVLATR